MLQVGEGEMSTLVVRESGRLPRFPEAVAAYVFGVLVAGLMTMMGAMLVHWRDRSVHTVEEFSAVVDLPVLGVVSEIRSAGQRRRLRFWQGVGWVVVVMICVVMVVGSGWFCYEGLATPQADLITFHKIG